MAAERARGRRDSKEVHLSSKMEHKAPNTTAMLALWTCYCSHSHPHSAFQRSSKKNWMMLKFISWLLFSVKILLSWKGTKGNKNLSLRRQRNYCGLCYSSFSAPQKTDTLCWWCLPRKASSFIVFRQKVGGCGSNRTKVLESANSKKIAHMDSARGTGTSGTGRVTPEQPRIPSSGLGT